MPFQAASIDQSVTSLISLQAIEDHEAYLMTVDDESIFIYNHSDSDTRQVDFGTDGQDYVGGKICNLQVSSNNKFFMIGIPEKRALGWFGLNRVHF